MRGADLRGADLRSADLSGADLRSADLSGADLRGADLRSAYMRGADLRGADLRSAIGADLAISKTRILPQGSLIGWKKCSGGCIVKLRIPEEAKRSHAFGRKCRAECAEVLEVTGPRGGKLQEAVSSYDSEFTYRVGQVVKPSNGFCEDWTDECASGIHFFITREEAEAYDP
jgi:hypothetical protein